jgi:hypothetical protein
MKEKLRSASILSLTIIVLLMASNRLPADTGTCSGAMTTVPFTDVMGNIFFCQIAEAFFSGLTNGTTPTTYSPSNSVPREQMAAFVTRTQDSALRRGSRRAALNQWWTPGDLSKSNFAFVANPPNLPALVASNGEDLWVANNIDGTVIRVHGGDMTSRGTWTGATAAFGVLVFGNEIWVTGHTSPQGSLYYIINTDSPGPIRVGGSVGGGPLGIATDGTNILDSERLRLGIKTRYYKRLPRYHPYRFQ